MKVFLIGYMGSGKSTIGKKLARRLDLKWLDLDHFIEQQQEQSIPEIFEAHGEPHFRELEGEALRDLIASEEALLISTGGGTPCFSNHLELMLHAGVVAFLDVPVPILVSRVMAAGDKRPLLAGKSAEELQEWMESHLQERLPFYEKAHVTIDGRNLSATDLDHWAEQIRYKAARTS